MRRSLALLIPAVLLAAACAQSPTAARQHPSARFDGGNTLGSGNAAGTPSDGGNTLGSGNAAGTTSDGGNTLGSGNAAGSGDGGNTLGSGN